MAIIAVCLGMWRGCTRNGGAGISYVNVNHLNAAPASVTASTFNRCSVTARHLRAQRNNVFNSRNQYRNRNNRAVAAIVCVRSRVTYRSNMCKRQYWRNVAYVMSVAAAA